MLDYYYIYNAINEPHDILRLFESNIDDIRHKIMMLPNINDDIIYPFDSIIYSEVCDQKSNLCTPGDKCLGCLLLRRLNGDKDIINNDTFKVGENNFIIKICKEPISGWHNTNETDFSYKKIVKTNSRAEQYLLCAISSDDIVVGAYYCRDRYVIIEKDDTYIGPIYPHMVITQLKDRLHGLSCILFTHGNPCKEYIKYVPEKWSMGEYLCDFSVKIINTSSDTIAINGLRYCRYQDDELCDFNISNSSADKIKYYEYLQERSFQGQTANPSEWEYKMFNESLLRIEDFKNALNDVKICF